MSCIQCGVPFSLKDKGYLFIKSAQDLYRYDFWDAGKGWWSYAYVNHSELLEKIEGIGGTLLEAPSSLSTSRKLPLLTITLGNLLIRLKNQDIISIIESGDLISFQQPIINLEKDDEIFGFESLLRTHGHEQISPGTLFSLAAKAGMLSLLDQRAREAAIMAKKRFLKPGVKSFINFLPSTIYNPDFCLRHTFSLVEKYEIDPADLVFEVVESEEIKDINHLKKVLNTYKKEGMKVALDDVGAGFSTLDVLKELQPDFLKIDRQYINYCDQDDRKMQFLTVVTQLANELGITVLAEGIERLEELEYCKSIGVKLAQGYLIGKPVFEPTYNQPFKVANY